MEQEVNRLHRQLSKRLRKPERKLLLKLTDMEMELRDRSNLDSIVDGYRVANGIHQELSRYPPYNFEDEDERRACQRMAENEEMRS